MDKDVIELLLNFLVLPISLLLFKMNNQIIKLDTELNNKKQRIQNIENEINKTGIIVAKIFEKLDENREDLHTINTKIEKMITKNTH